MSHRTPRILLALGLALALAACSAEAGGDPGGGRGRGADGGAADGEGPKDDDASASGDDGSVGTRDGGPGTGADGGAVDLGPTGCGDTEICGNGIDDDCDGAADEMCGCLPGDTQRCYVGPPSQAGRGVCSFGSQTCGGTSEFGEWGPCTGSGAPQALDCTRPPGDYDCDGAMDPGCVCTPGETRACYSGPAGTSGVGVCRSGSETCAATATGSGWGPCSGEITPSMELCDGSDYDCDGAANSGCGCVIGTSRSCYSGPAGTSGVGICRAGSQRCVAIAGGASWDSCGGEVLPAADRCDGIDYQCTGAPGAGCICLIGSMRACYEGPAGTRGVGACRDGAQTCVASGAGSDWGAGCAGQAVPGSELCGNSIDDNCNGAVDEGCGGTLMCPGDLTVEAGYPISLSALGMGIVSYSWRIVSGPTGGAGTSVWSPAPPTAATESFTPTIVGEYVIEVSGVDIAGRTIVCRFTVSALPHGLRVEVTWDGAGDVDLHMHNNTSTAWFTTNDCYYSNTATTWGANLDFDNTSSAGPENIRMDAPALASDYTIAVHNYARSAGRIATVRVFCGSTTSTTPTMTFTSRALAGTAAGNCTANDFWKVARVRFSSATACTITPINTYQTSSSVCTAF